MKRTIHFAILWLSFVSAGCAKVEFHTRHQARFVNFNTGQPAAGIKMRLDRTIYDVDHPFGYTEFYGTMVTDQRGALSFEANGDFSYSALSDTLRGPLAISTMGSQGTVSNGILTCQLYPSTQLRFTHAAGDYLSAEILTRPDSSVANYTVVQSEGTVSGPSTISTAAVWLLTERPNTVHLRVTLKDSTVKEHDYTITPVDHQPVNLEIPY